jgi:hypothetical protein
MIDEIAAINNIFSIKNSSQFLAMIAASQLISLSLILELR